MREIRFLQCGAEGAAGAADWAESTLRGAGLSEAAAQAAARRLQEGLRAAAEAFACRAAGPEAMLVLTFEDGAPVFELLADGAPPAAWDAPLGALWQAAERRAAGGGCLRLRMAAGLQEAPADQAAGPVSIGASGSAPHSSSEPS
jgi:hypothetical protein